MQPYEPYFLEDLIVGQEFTTPRRTVTETDLITFAMLSSDWNPVHTDTQAAQSAGFSDRIVHGALGLSLATGLLQRTGMFDGSAVALLGFQEWRFDRPLLLGDTVHARMRIAGTRRTSRGDRGVVDRELALVNQHGETVQHGRSDFMVWSKDSAHYRHLSTRVQEVG